MHYKVAMILLGGFVFLLSGGAFLGVKIFLRPKHDSNLDDWHYEFEEQHPQLARYEKWSRVTFIGVVIGILMLFVALVL